MKTLRGRNPPQTNQDRKTSQNHSHKKKGVKRRNMSQRKKMKVGRVMRDERLNLLVCCNFIYFEKITKTM